MDDEQLIKNAAVAMGAGQLDDYKIAPTQHADSLEATAAALAKILRSSQLGTAASQYEEKDLAATEAQAVFRKIAKRANWGRVFDRLFQRRAPDRATVGPRLKVATGNTWWLRHSFRCSWRDVAV